MKIERMIKIQGLQRNQEGEENKIELSTMGSVYEKNNNVYVVYEETEISGMEGTTTTLKIEGTNRLSMQRYGNTTSKMVFEEGKRHISDYRTLYGDFKMEVVTSSLNIKLDVEGLKGSLELHYDLSISGLVESQNLLTICF